MRLTGDLGGHHLHLFGVTGRGMAPLAITATRLGATVTGCDRAPQPGRLDELTRAGITVAPDHDPAHLDSSVTALVATSVAPRTDPEIAAAADRGVLHHRTDLLAACLAARPGAGITGSHGKGTVAALTAAALVEAGLDPLTLIGVDAPAVGGIARPGAGPLVAEVDDSDTTLCEVASDVAVVTNLDQDHPHLGFTLRETVAAVASFVGHARRRVVIGPTPRAATLAGAAKAPVWSFGRELNGRLRSARSGRSEITVDAPGFRQDVTLHLLTPHAHVNAALALAAAVSMGADPAAAAQGMGRVERIYRRLEPLGESAGVRVYDDFGGKHPACVRGGIAALRRHYPAARVTAVFEPWGPYLPTFGKRYARVLSGADRVVLAPPFVLADYAVSSPRATAWWADCRSPVTLAASREEATQAAMDGTRPGDIVVFFAQFNASRSMALAAAGQPRPVLASAGRHGR